MNRKKYIIMNDCFVRHLYIHLYFKQALELVAHRTLHRTDSLSKKKCCLSNRLSNLDTNKLIPYNKKNTSNNKKIPSMIRVSTSVKL